MREFIRKHAAGVMGALSGFDRVRFRETQRLPAKVRGMTGFLRKAQVLLEEFKVDALNLTERNAKDG